MGTICLDFDGVLHDAANPVPGRRMGLPLPGALDAVKFLARRHTLLIYTARVHAPDRAQHILDWLTYYGFPQIGVRAFKPVADLYVDDKGFRFTGWHKGGMHDLLETLRGRS